MATPPEFRRQKIYIIYSKHFRDSKLSNTISITSFYTPFWEVFISILRIVDIYIYDHHIKQNINKIFPCKRNFRKVNISKTFQINELSRVDHKKQVFFWGMSYWIPLDNEVFSRDRTAKIFLLGARNLETISNKLRKMLIDIFLRN
jgi:hypothetical protein